jgi:uncharacterized heparinase superfamily protein
VDDSPRPVLRAVHGVWVVPARRHEILKDAETFFVLNETGRLSEIGWDGPQREKLWRYNQHYFDDLNARNAVMRSEWHKSLIENWIRENKPGRGTGWEPYPTSLRIVNWISSQFAGLSLAEVCLQSLATQVRWLHCHLEWHILGNHLFANAKALIFAGLFFEGPEAQKWLEKGLNILSKELPVQVLSDGGNFELSPMYHAIFLEDLLHLINVAGVYPNLIDSKQVIGWRATATKMLNWLAGMCHPDGEIAFFNDAAIGVAPAPSDIQAYANRLGIRAVSAKKSCINPSVIQFENSGYIRLESANAVAILDVAPIGPDYLPGHAHADTLSFELSLFDKRVFVNGGTSQYGVGANRITERSTQSHNTVEINGENSSEVWSGFRVAKRAYTRGLEIKNIESTVCVSCEHDGYERLPGRALHRRTWHFSHGKLVVQDFISGEYESAVARFHLHPDIKIIEFDGFNYALFIPESGRSVRVAIVSGIASIEQSHFAPEFGVRLNSKCIAVRLKSDNEIKVEISWSNNE